MACEKHYVGNISFCWNKASDLHDEDEESQMKILFMGMKCLRACWTPVNPRDEIRIFLIFLVPEGVKETIRKLKNVAKKRIREILQVMM